MFRPTSHKTRMLSPSNVIFPLISSASLTNVLVIKRLSTCAQPCIASVAYIFHATNGEEITVHATEIANNKISSQLANTRRENIFFQHFRARPRVSGEKSRGEKSRLYRACARGRFTDSFCERGREQIVNAERTIAIGRSLFSALLRRKRFVDLRQRKKRKTIPACNEGNVYRSNEKFCALIKQHIFPKSIFSSLFAGLYIRRKTLI